MNLDEREIESFLSDSRKNDHRSARTDKKYKTLLNKATQSQHFFKIAIVLPVLVALSSIYLVDRHLLKQSAESARKATTGAVVARANAGVTTYKSVLSKGVSNKEPSLTDLKALSTSDLVSKLQSTSSETIQTNVLRQTGRQISDAQVKKAQHTAGSSSVLNKIDSTRQSYSGSSSEAIAEIRSKLDN